jgi:hypothetical protein
MTTLTAPAALALLAAVQAAAPAPQPPPRAVPFDCSWIYHPPAGRTERFEGVFTAFIDDGGFYACASDEECRAWIGKESVELSFTGRAARQFDRHTSRQYGVFRIAFEGRRGKLGDRPGCEPHGWMLERRSNDYVRVDKVLSARPFDDFAR